MTNEKTFKASNGYEIRSNFGYFDEHEDCYEVRDIDNYIWHRLGSRELQALREYFQHERDELLGRARWPEDPDYVIYRDDEDDEDDRCVRVINEQTGRSWWEWENGQSYARVAARAADWYFSEGPGKPERPWEQAQAGEVWRLTVDGKDGTFLVRGTDSGTPFFCGQRAYLGADHTDITAGRKLLNADGSVVDE